MASTTPPSVPEACFSAYNATLYVPIGTIDTYRQHPVWSLFANIVEGCPTGIGETMADAIENGTVEFAAASYTKSKTIMTVNKGDEVTITATPAEGYHLKGVTVTGLEADLWVEVTDGKFLMPDADVVVNATFEKDLELACALPNVNELKL